MRGVGHSQEKSYAEPGNKDLSAPVGMSTWSSVTASLNPRLGRAARLIVRRLQRLFLVCHRDNEALALGVVRSPVYSPKLERFVSIHPDMGFAPASVAEA
jgi:hypothetical protein